MTKLITRVKANVTNTKKSGAATLALILETVEHAIAEKDWTPLAWFIAKTDTTDSRVIRRITGSVFPEVKMQTKSANALKQPSGLYMDGFKGNGPVVNERKLAVLRKAVESGMSFRAAAFGQVMFDKAEKAEKTKQEKIEGWLKYSAKIVADDNITWADLINAHTAKEKNAEQKGNVNVKA